MDILQQALQKYEKESRWNLVKQIKIKVNGGGQECPPYTSKVTALIKISTANQNH